MRFNVVLNNQKIFIGFNAKNFRFVFYTHGKIYSVNEWKNLVEKENLTIFDENENKLSWEEFIKFVEHLQYFSNSTWVNNYFISNEGYNFSNNLISTKKK